MLTKDQIKYFLSQNIIYKYNINEDNTVDVFQNVRIQTHQEECPVKFGKVTGDFIINHCGLKSLKNMPSIVQGTFDCSENDIKNLVGGPLTVMRNYFCSHSGLITLEGVPEYIYGDLDISENLLTNFKWAPKSVSKLINAQKNNITDLNGIPYTNNDYINLNFNPIKKLNLKDLEHLDHNLTICFCDKNDILIEFFESLYSIHKDLEISVAQIRKILLYHDMNQNFNLNPKKITLKI